MATSVVNRVIEPTKPTFKAGELVTYKDGLVMMVILSNNVSVEAIRLSGPFVGHKETWDKNNCRPFKGSVTLTEE